MVLATILIFTLIPSGRAQKHLFTTVNLKGKMEVSIMVEIITADQIGHKKEIRELFLEYLDWVFLKIKEEFGINLKEQTSAEGYADADMQKLDQFMPPKGRLLLCFAENQLAGIACLKYLQPGIGEIKRMYVRPENRKAGIGRALINQLLTEAIQVGYERIRLDSARFMHPAHNLYQAMGFHEIEAYEGSEIPKEWQVHWIFMEKELRGLD
jgi:GNAT superfamily N-acetyltransferase